jgi:hypothetical protein
MYLDRKFFRAAFPRTLETMVALWYTLSRGESHFVILALIYNRLIKDKCEAGGASERRTKRL